MEVDMFEGILMEVVVSWRAWHRQEKFSRENFVGVVPEETITNVKYMSTKEKGEGK